MNFALSEEQQDIRNLAQQILGDMCAVDRLRKLEAADTVYDTELWSALAEAGLLGIAIDEARGGMGFGFDSLCVLLEAVGVNVAKVPVLPVLVGAALPLQHFASDTQCQRWLPAIVTGKVLLTAARIEPENDNPLRLAAVAKADGDGFRVSGEKHCVPVAAQADGIVLAALHKQEPVVLVVDPTAKGVSLRPQRVTSGEICYHVTMQDVVVNDDAVLASGEQARQWLQWTEQHYRAALCSMATGLCDKMMRMTAQYTTEREQFGRAIGTFQAVSHRMADCYIDVECLRLVSQQAVYQLNSGADAEDAVAVAKAWCGEVTHRVSQAAQHCHGGIGVDRDYPLFRYCLWAREIELTGGSTAALTADIGRRIAGTLSS